MVVALVLCLRGKRQVTGGTKRLQECSHPQPSAHWAQGHPDPIPCFPPPRISQCHPEDRDLLPPGKKEVSSLVLTNIHCPSCKGNSTNQESLSRALQKKPTGCAVAGPSASSALLLPLLHLQNWRLLPEIYSSWLLIRFSKNLSKCPEKGFPSLPSSQARSSGPCSGLQPQTDGGNNQRPTNKPPRYIFLQNEFH